MVVVSMEPDLDRRIQLVQKHPACMLAIEQINQISSIRIAHHYHAMAKFLRAAGCIDQAYDAPKQAVRFHPYYANSIALLRSVTSDRAYASTLFKALGLTISCNKYYERAVRLYHFLRKFNLPFEIKIVVGASARKPPVSSSCTIRVDAGNHYEDLAGKVSQAFVHIATSYAGPVDVFKIADDSLLSTQNYFQGM